MSEIHGWVHAPNGADAIDAPYEIKVYPDENSPAALESPDLAIVVVSDGVWIHAMGRDVGGTYLREADAYVTTAGGVTVMLRNVTQAVDMLTSPITINAGGFTSYNDGSSGVIDVDNSLVALGDLIAIDVDSVDGEPKGLGVHLFFGPRLSV